MINLSEYICSQSSTATLTCIIPDIVVGADLADLIALNHVEVPDFTVDRIVENIEHDGRWDVAKRATNLVFKAETTTDDVE